MKQFLHFQPQTTTFTLPYFVTRPDDTIGEALPMIVFLHGAGERGDDLSRLAVHGIPHYFDKDETSALRLPVNGAKVMRYGEALPKRGKKSKCVLADSIFDQTIFNLVDYQRGIVNKALLQFIGIPFCLFNRGNRLIPTH